MYTYGHTLSLHDALPIYANLLSSRGANGERGTPPTGCSPMLLSPSDFTDNGLGRAGRDRLRLAAILASGGDARIRPAAEGRNKYYASVFPSAALAYGPSTINRISQHSFYLPAPRSRARPARLMDAVAYSAPPPGLRQRIPDY